MIAGVSSSMIVPIAAQVSKHTAPDTLEKKTRICSFGSIRVSPQIGTRTKRSPMAGGGLVPMLKGELMKTTKYTFPPQKEPEGGAAQVPLVKGTDENCPHKI